MVFVRRGPHGVEALPVRVERVAEQEEGEAKGQKVQDVVDDADPGRDQEGLAELDAESAVEQEDADLDQADGHDVAPQADPDVESRPDKGVDLDVPDVSTGVVDFVADDDQDAQCDDDTQGQNHEEVVQARCFCDEESRVDSCRDNDETDDGEYDAYVFQSRPPGGGINIVRFGPCRNDRRRG